MTFRSLCLHVSRTVQAGSLQGAAGLAGVLGPQPKSAALGTWQRRHLVCYHQLHAAREETEPQRLTSERGPQASKNTSKQKQI